jgi:uncharacterized membrane protein
MLDDRQVPMPAILEIGSRDKLDGEHMPRIVAAAGKEQYVKYTMQRLKSMTIQQRKERKKLLEETGKKPSICSKSRRNSKNS